MSKRKYFLGFEKSELIAVVTIFFFLIMAIAINLRISLRKSRDAQRKADIRNIYDALNAYQNDFGFFPFSTEDGKILACPPYDVESRIFSACEWGKDAIADIFDKTYPAYLKVLPIDPFDGDGVVYFYVSNGNRYQIFASLESSSEDEYSQEIKARALPCGTKICNFGRAFSDTPLDISLEEYESMLESEE